MTINITLPRIPVLTVAEHGLRLLLPVALPAILVAVADAYGVGLLVRILEIGFKIARSTAHD
ncbi:hypothetical protein [Streptomyces colonosanans]|uniref:Uncharacterized protein n=1 Tax=Streptomyces colonosanans TaxID=1428652 RepID=A0A1S2NZ92_9ACTN|nr:hypothetical protein [Streptomyces colonosanans]OIJ86797.1 hypothetical protein BIV24_25595 [Streptomyces colonosanans]